jgi:hypothetical protein
MIAPAFYPIGAVCEHVSGDEIWTLGPDTRFHFTHWQRVQAAKARVEGDSPSLPWLSTQWKRPKKRKIA